MKTYVCKNCGYIETKEELESDYVCPKCNALKDSFEVFHENLAENEIDAIVDSVIEDAIESNKPSKIVNEKEEEKSIRISEYNTAITRIPEKCINCGQCKKTCENIVNLRYDLNKCKEPICIGCGQCILNCPTGALVPKYEYKEVKEILDANEKIVVAIISPAVRVSIGESFGLEPGVNSEKKLVSALKQLGFDFVYDTAFGADLTVLEEAAEFIERLQNKKALPQFTSCCPAWVKYAEIYHPELLDNLSTCKSPIGMQCAIIKSYFCEKKGFDPSKIVTVAITPCTAKKMEAREYTLNIDHVLTASELELLLKEEEIKLPELEDRDFDQLMGESSGAGVIFGSSGGVCESILRTLNKILTNKNLTKDELRFEELEGFEGIKEASILIGKYKVKVAVVQQMENLEKILENNYYKQFHLIEVMNCKGGCIGGGGQPLCQIPKLDEYREKRSKGLFEIDKKRAVRSAHDNAEIKLLYKEYLKNPMSEKSFELLHTSYTDKSNLLNNK